MMDAAISPRPPDEVAVIVVHEGKTHFVRSDTCMTMAEVRERWLGEIDQQISVAFFTLIYRYLSDDQTVGSALNDPDARSLELRTFPKSRYELQIFGLEDTVTIYEVAAILNPAEVRLEIKKELDILHDDFRLTCNNKVLDQELSFNRQGLMEGAQLVVDLGVDVHVHFEQDDRNMREVRCFTSSSIGDLRRKLNFGDKTVLVVTEPYRHVLDDNLHVCHVREPLDPHIPIALTAEDKIMMNFQPITLEHLRQPLAVAPSATPLDLYDLVSERFRLATEHRLVVNGEELDNCKPLRNQLYDFDCILEIDIVRTCVVKDLWKEESDEEVYPYSSERAHSLFRRNELNNQRLVYDKIHLTIFGSMVNVFGPISGQQNPVLNIARDVERSLQLLSIDSVIRRLGWATDRLLDILPISGGVLRKEIMWNGKEHCLFQAKATLSQLRLTENALMIMDPEKIFITSAEKKLRMLRFAHGSTYSDVRERMEQEERSKLVNPDDPESFKNRQACFNVSLKASTGNQLISNAEMDRKMDSERNFLTTASRVQTKVTVRMGDESYECSFEPQEVTFTDIMIKVGTQAKVPPRHLFSQTLYCCGCGRQLSMEEEPYQVVPAYCCRARSLRLTDRRVKEVGIQTAVPRPRDASTYTLDPESRDACVNTEFDRQRAIIDTATEYESATTAPYKPSSLLCIMAQSPDGDSEWKTIAVEDGSNCRALLGAADCQLESVSVGESPLMYSMERIYNRGDEERTAVTYFDQNGMEYFFADSEDDEIVASTSSWKRYSLRFLRPASPVPSSTCRPPFLFIYNDVEFFTIDPFRQLQPATAEALTDPAFIVLMVGIRLEKSFFWQVSNALLVSAETGRILSPDEISAEFLTDEEESRTWLRKSTRFIIALLRHADRVPRIKVPNFYTLYLFRRPNVKLDMLEDSVFGKGFPPPSDLDRWDILRGNDDFDENYTAAARK